MLQVTTELNSTSRFASSEIERKLNVEIPGRKKPRGKG